MSTGVSFYGAGLTHHIQLEADSFSPSIVRLRISTSRGELVLGEVLDPWELLRFAEALKGMLTAPEQLVSIGDAA